MTIDGHFSSFLCLFQVAFSNRKKVEGSRGKVINFVGAKPDVILVSTPKRGLHRAEPILTASHLPALQPGEASTS